jgi:hypothetical protein
MCNIITFRFACQHTLRRRRSRCNGTKHKITATSTKAACVAESFLTIYPRIECGPCQHKAWEDRWKLKLERANTFLTKLRQRDMPGVEEVTLQVKELEAEYATESWHTRNMFAHASKPSVTRVQHGRYEKKPSKLPQELHPGDIVDKAAKTWAEMNDHDYDDNYEASTDPIHPVSTDYSHPLDDDDGDWILQHLEPEDGADIHSGSGMDFSTDDHGWNWDNDNNINTATELANNEQQKHNTRQDNEESTTMLVKETETNFVTCTLNTDASQPTSIITIHPSASTTEEEKERKEKVDRVIQTFWSVVHYNHDHDHDHNHNQNTQSIPTLAAKSPPPSSPSLPPNDNNTLTVSDRPAPLLPQNTHLPRPRPLLESHNHHPPTLWIDGPSDPPHFHVQQSPRSSNSTRAWYDKQRAFLRQRRDEEEGGRGADSGKFYRDWLLVSRCEIRDFEGPEGRVIRDPLVGK